MQGREVMQDHRESRVSRVFAATSDRKAIRAVKALRVILDRQGLPDQRDRWDLPDRRVILDRKGQEVFRALPDLPGQRDRWDRRV